MRRVPTSWRVASARLRAALFTVVTSRPGPSGVIAPAGSAAPTPALAGGQLPDGP